MTRFYKHHDHERTPGAPRETPSHSSHGFRSPFHHHDRYRLNQGLPAEQGLRAIRWSFFGLVLTAVVQAFVTAFSGSMALLGDTLHNIGDALTAIPLWIAFMLARRPPTSRFTYGFGRVEDLAGVAIVIAILASALMAGYESLMRLWHPQQVEHLWAVASAAIIGFAGNEAVAVYRLRVGRRIGSWALIAEGQHARIDGWISLTVLGGAAGIRLGYPWMDPVIGLGLAVVIVWIAWSTGKAVLTRLLDGVDPEMVTIIEETALSHRAVREATDIRVRWSGHRLHAEINITVDPHLSVEEGHAIADDVRHALLHELNGLSTVTIHIDPATASGDGFHRVSAHTHGNLPVHSH